MILFFKIYLIIYLIYRFEPLWLIVDDMFNKVLDNTIDSSLKYIILNKVWEVIGCHKCVLFWTNLIILDIWYAIVGLIIVEINNRLIK